MRFPRCLLTATLLCLLAPSWAMACQGQAGKTIFEDDFSDDSGGWDLGDANIKLKDSALAIGFNNQYQRRSTMVAAFNVPEGDFCMDVALPPSVAPDNLYGAGLQFWLHDYDNRYYVILQSDATVSFGQVTGGNGTLIWSVPAPSFRSGPSATNELRALVKGGKATIFLNGAKVKTTRIQSPVAPLHFGVSGQVNKPGPTLTPIRFTHFKVTSGE